MDDFRGLARSIRLVSLDCDGTMTDGRVFYGDGGDRLRAFHVRDGVGIRRMMQAGLAVAFVSASGAEAIARRAAELGVAHCLTGAADKLAALDGLCARLGFGLDAVAHLGDDLNDLPVLVRVGLPAAVADAVPELREAARFVTARRGGDGAVREFADRLLAARGAPGG